MTVDIASIGKVGDRDRDFPVHAKGMVFTVQVTGNYQSQVKGNKNPVIYTAIP